MLNVLVPMSGAGSRFVAAGYQAPKPMIMVGRRMMIEVVIENIRPSCDHQFIFICQKAHLDNSELAETLSKAAPGCKIVIADGLTEGAACSVLLARELLENDDALMMANCDQYVDMDIDAFVSEAKTSDMDGFIMTMTAFDNRWSFVKFDNNGSISGVYEKQVVSDEATVGIYYFKKSRDFVTYADAMIAKGLRVNGEFYVAPVYNELLLDGLSIGIQNIGPLSTQMHGLGVPEDLEAFLETSIFENKVNLG